MVRSSVCLAAVRFPREFGLFLKQLLYFDRFVRILAPSLQVSVLAGVG
jgi:hypothetical protein